MASTSSKAAENAREEMESARSELVECEKEIQTIKTALRELASSTQQEEDGSETPNSMEVVVLKVDGLPEDAKPSFTLQLSSPIEEIELSKLFDPLDDSTESSGSKAIFQGVETSMATLSVSAKDSDVPLGLSASYDVAPLCVVEQEKEIYVTELAVAIVPTESENTVTLEEKAKTIENEVFEDAVDQEEKEESADKMTEEGDAEKGNLAAEEVPKEVTSTKIEEPSSLHVPICTVTLRVTFKPSAKDKQGELYEQLNKVSQRKAQSIDRLRKSATAVSRAAPPLDSNAVATRGKPAVKPGFLNKAENEKKINPVVRFYQKWLGPQSIVRGVFPVAKNYIIFFGCATFFHLKGQMLALPPPV